MMFFQVALLLGYFYAHGIRTLFGPRTTFIVHCIAITSSLYFLDLNLLKSGQASDQLALNVSKELWIALGIPFVFLSASSPLIQAWQSTSHDSKQTYRLYAWSNAGSLAALISYPFLIERFGLNLQASIFKFGMFGLVLMMIVSGIQVFRHQKWVGNVADQSDEGRSSSISPLKIVFWLFAAASASALLISTTNILCQEVASFPFLWILPLTLYLLSFIICFDRPNWYSRRIFLFLFATAIYAAILLLHFGPNAGLVLQVVGFGALVFSGSIICHGELYRLKPTTKSLTLFYLCIATGGAVGSAVVTVIAPNVLDHYFEFHASILLCLLVPVVVLVSEIASTSKSNAAGTLSLGRFYTVVLLCMAGAMPVICSKYFLSSPVYQTTQIVRWRNEYGIVSVSEDEQYRKMFNGQTNHGGQFLDASKQLEPNAYYSAGSGVDVAFQLARQQKQELDVCVIGLGTGSMMSYGRTDDEFRFYEINPLSVTAAKQFFTYLDSDKAEIVVGDGRLELEKENRAGIQHRFDMIFVDAFSSDSIPVHLLTQECIDLYFRNLSDNGLLVFHITNKFIDLMPVIASLRTENELDTLLVNHENDDFEIATKWVIATKNNQYFQTEIAKTNQTAWPTGIKPVQWTDDYSSVAPLVRWWQELNY